MCPKPYFLLTSKALWHRKCCPTLKADSHSYKINPCQAEFILRNIKYICISNYDALLPLCKGNLLVTSGFRSKRTSNIQLWCVVIFVASLNKFPHHAPGARFTNGFCITIQIRWKFRFTLTSILIQWTLQNFVHGTAAVLSWHVQKFVAIWWPATELWQGEVSIEFELRAKNVSETGPRRLLTHWHLLSHSADITLKNTLLQLMAWW